MDDGPEHRSRSGGRDIDAHEEAVVEAMAGFNPPGWRTSLAEKLQYLTREMIRRGWIADPDVAPEVEKVATVLGVEGEIQRVLGGD